ncbi:MAG: hypothetical protein V4613_11755 [Bacteroidota bacterium]
MKQYLIIASAVILAACTAKKVAVNTPTPEPAPATVPAPETKPVIAISQPTGPAQFDVDRMAAKFPDQTLASLNDGKIQYETHCQTCHALYKADSEGEAEWNVIVPDMVKKVNRKAGTVAVDSTRQKVILRYLITMGSREKTK